MATTVSLPGISAVDRSDRHIGLFLSELDELVTQVEAFDREQVPLEDAVFLDRHGMAVAEEFRREIDTALFAT